MIRPLLWVVLGILLSLLLVPIKALQAAAPVLVVIAVGLVIVVVAGFRGRRAERDQSRAEQPEAATEMEQ